MIKNKKYNIGFTDLNNNQVSCALWYPSLSNTSERYQYKGLYVGGKVTEQASIAPGIYSLVLISHCSHGNKYDQSYLAEYLAAEGYMVLAIQHTDKLLTDNDSIPLATKVRVQEIEAALSLIYQHPIFSKSTDCNGVGIIGHSFGAYVGLLLAGASSTYNNTIPKIKSLKYLITIAPPLHSRIDKKSLINISLPIAIIAAGQDEVIHDGAEVYHRYLPNVAYHYFEDASHFTFLSECTKTFKKLNRQVCKDYFSVRSSLHPKIADICLNFIKNNYLIKS
jgi:predicted dienelactone hydrolase